MLWNGQQYGHNARLMSYSLYICEMLYYVMPLYAAMHMAGSFSFE